MWAQLAQISMVLSARPGLTLLLWAAAFLLAAVLMLAKWRREEIRRDEERTRLNRIIQASRHPEPPTWPRPSGPKGFSRNGNGRAA